MCLFDALLIWKTTTSQLHGVDVHIYQFGDEIKTHDIDDFSYEHYTLHDRHTYLAGIELQKKGILK